MYISISSYTYTYRYIHIHINIYIHTSSTATTTMTHPHIHRGGEALETKESQQHQKQAEPHHSPTTTGGGGDHDPSTGGGGGGGRRCTIYVGFPLARVDFSLHGMLFLSFLKWPKESVMTSPWLGDWIPSPKRNMLRFIRGIISENFAPKTYLCKWSLGFVLSSKTCIGKNLFHIVYLVYVVYVVHVIAYVCMFIYIYIHTLCATL